MATNETLMQYFYWDYPADGTLWGEMARNASELARAGITALWLPSPCKAREGYSDVGYGLYDLWDLGEFDQKGSARTKYGTRVELEAAIAAAHAAGLRIYLDVVLNHKAGADATEAVTAIPVSQDNRNIEIGPAREIDVWTSFSFPGRGDTYSSFKWNWSHFDAVDFDQRTGAREIFRLRDKVFQTPVDPERGNFDYLMFADLDMSNAEVRTELNRWGDWIVRTLNVDGFRLDAVKHIRFPFFNEWLDAVRATFPDRSLFTVGEYFSGNLATLEWFLDQTGRRMSLFDFPLYFNLRAASEGSGHFDMRNLLNDTLLARDPALAATFTDNHDTYRERTIQGWFKPLAYALILLWDGGRPCLFYPDYYGAPGQPSHRRMLDRLLAVRRDHAYGAQNTYFDHPDVVGWTRSGDADHPRAIAVLLSDGPGGSKRMNVNRPNRAFLDATDNIGDAIVAGADGWGEFRCNGGSVSVWAEQ